MKGYSKATITAIPKQQSPLFQSNNHRYSKATITAHPGSVPPLSR
jgi:hypothetical protein